MSYKNFICTGPNDVAKYNNDPLAPDFLEHFAKTSYITADFQKTLAVPPDHKNKFELTWRGPLCITPSMDFMKALLQKHIDEYSQYVVQAFFVLHDIRENNNSYFWYDERLGSNINFKKFLDVLVYDSIISEQLFIYDYNSGEYLTYVEYYGHG